MIARDRQKSLMVALIGNTNVGKSTLVNALTLSTVSIATRKPHTTRSAIRAIITHGDTQIVLIDTPGFTGNKKATQSILGETTTTIRQCEAMLLLIDAAKPFSSRHLAPLQAASHIPDAKKIIALNKVDRVEKTSLLPIAAEIGEANDVPLFMISARKGSGINRLKSHLTSLALPQPWPYPQQQISNQSPETLACEFTRKHILTQLHGEVPYEVSVRPVTWQEKGGQATIHQTIIVDKESQKAILVGKQGARLKAIGSAARRAISAHLGKPAHLFLRVATAPRKKR